MIRHNRLLVAFHVISDSLLGVCAFIVAYIIRFQLDIIPITKAPERRLDPSNWIALCRSCNTTQAYEDA